MLSIKDYNLVAKEKDKVKYREGAESKQISKGRVHGVSEGIYQL